MKQVLLLLFMGLSLFLWGQTESEDVSKDKFLIIKGMTNNSRGTKTVNETSVASSLGTSNMAGSLLGVGLEIGCIKSKGVGFYGDIMYNYSMNKSVYKEKLSYSNLDIGLGLYVELFQLQGWQTTFAKIGIINGLAFSPSISMDGEKLLIEDALKLGNNWGTSAGIGWRTNHFTFEVGTKFRWTYYTADNASMMLNMFGSELSFGYIF